MLRNKIISQNKKTTIFETVWNGKRYECLIDTEDFYSLPNRMVTLRDGKRLYLKIHYQGKQQYLHRLIMGTPNYLVTDHLSHNPLDNRKSKLRIVTQKQNLKNRKRK